MKKLVKENPPKWKVILLKQHPEVTNINKQGSALFLGKTSNSFWTDFFEALNNISKRVEPRDSEELLAEPLFDNDKFKIGERTIHFKNWIERGIYTVGSLIKENGTFMTLQDIQINYNLTPRFLDYLGCINTIKKYCTKTIIQIFEVFSQRNTKCDGILRFSFEIWFPWRNFCHSQSGSNLFFLLSLRNRPNFFLCFCLLVCLFVRLFVITNENSEIIFFFLFVITI